MSELSFAIDHVLEPMVKAGEGIDDAWKSTYEALAWISGGFFKEEFNVRYRGKNVTWNTMEGFPFSFVAQKPGIA